MANYSERRSLTSAPLHYIKAYQVYVKKSTAQKETVKWVEQNLPKILKQAFSTGQVPETFNILSIGCGDGSVGDLLVLKTVANFLRSSKPNVKPAVFNQAVDPSSDAMTAFQSAVNLWKEECDVNFSFESSVKTWEDYVVGTKKEQKKFHVISFVQSIYYIDPEATLRNCLEERLAENGIIFCMNVSQNVFFNHFAKRFYGTELLIIPTGITYHTSESVAAIAEKNGWRYEHFVFDFSLDVEDIYDESSVEGSLLIDFLVQTVNFRDVTGKADEQSVLKFLSDRCQTGNNNKKILREDVGVVVIFKH